MERPLLLDRARIGRLALVFIAIAAYCAMALAGVSGKSTTSDEVAHVTGGYSYWTTGDYRLQPENGNWPQRWVGLAVGFGDSRPSVSSIEGWERSDVFTVADHLFHDSGVDAATLLWHARWMAVVFGAAAAALVFAWSSRLFGTRGGWISLAVFVFSPTVLAHGPLATSDMAATLFFTASVWLIWTLLHTIRPTTVVASVICVAGLLLSKFSGPIILPIAGVLIAIRLAVPRPLVVRWRARTIEVAGRPWLLTAFSGLLLAHVVGAGAIIWMSYGFRFSAMATGAAPAEFLVPWPQLLGDLGTMGDIVSWAREHRVLPEAYLYGFSQTAYYAQHRVAFFNGQVSDVGGWLGYFPYSAAVKETIPVLALMVWSVALLVRRRRRGKAADGNAGPPPYETAPLWTLILVYWAFALNSNLNIGYRHLLPTLPATYILMGSIGTVMIPWRRLRSFGREAVATLAATVLLAWHAGESLRIAPHYLAYFNEIVGGSSQGYKHLVDSSLDWGQDLPGVKRWLDAEGLQGAGHVPVYFSYFGNGRPFYYGIDALPLPSFPDRSRPQVPRPLAGGVYLISATMYQGIYLTGSGPWTDAYQRQYEAAVFNMLVFDRTAANPADRERLLKQTGEAFWWKNFSVFEQLRFARLAAYLRQREPVSTIGYSVLVFRLTDAEVNEALRVDRRP